jgi:hypothetical protein
MPVDLAAAFTGGGKLLTDVLQFCIVSGRPDPVFVFLAREYRARPTAAGALALYDVFCAPGAPCRLRAGDHLPPRNPSLAAAVAPIRAAVDRARAPRPEPAEGEEPADPPWVPLPPNSLFAALADAVAADPDGPAAAVAREFDPALGPAGSLPGGAPTPGQRAFAERAWLRGARPVLVAAGFWRVATIGPV